MSIVLLLILSLGGPGRFCSLTAACGSNVPGFLYREATLLPFYAWEPYLHPSYEEHQYVYCFLPSRLGRKRLQYIFEFSTQDMDSTLRMNA
jgi:hypothetical protein